MHVLLTVDCDDETRPLIETCRELTAADGSRVTVLGVTPDLAGLGLFTSATQDAQSSLIDDVRSRAADICDGIDGPHEIHLASGKVDTEIIKAATLHDVDCVIKAADVDASGKSIAHGQVAKALLRKCPVPVWITSASSKHPPQTICVAIDNVALASNRAEATLLTLALVKHAVTLAQRLGLKEVTLLHAWSAAGLAFLDRPRARVAPADIERYMHDCEASARKAISGIADLVDAKFADTGIAFKTHLVMGLPHIAIPQATKDLDADILVIGSANRTGIMGLLVGNTAEAIVNALECSVYVVKPEDISALISLEVEKSEGRAASAP